MDRADVARGLFGYELALGLLGGLVVKGAFSKSAAKALLDDCASNLCATWPDRAPEFRDVAARSSARIERLAAKAGRPAGEDDA